MSLYVGLGVYDTNVLDAAVLFVLLVRIHLGIRDELSPIGVWDAIGTVVPTHERGNIASEQISVVFLSCMCGHLALVYVFRSAGGNGHE